MKLLKKVLIVLGIIIAFVLVAKESELAGNILSAVAGGALAVVNGVIDIAKNFF